MKRKAICSILAFLFIICSNAVYAEVPSGTVVFDDKAYSLKYVNDTSNRNIVRDIIRNSDTIYIKVRGVWYANDGTKISKDDLGEIKYFQENGQVYVYGEKDGELISDDLFKVLDISFVDEKTAEIVFSHEVKNEGLSENIKVSDNLEISKVELGENKDRVILKFKNAVPKEGMENTIQVSKKIKSADDKELLSDYSREILVLRDKKIVDRTFDQNVSLIADDFYGENLTFKKAVSLTGDNGELRDSKVQSLILNPGKDGNSRISNVEVDALSVFSGASHSIIIEESKIEKMEVQSSSNTRVMTEGDSKIHMIQVKSDVILESDSAAFEDINIAGSKAEKKVTLKGEFKKVTAGDNSFVVADGDSKVEEILINGKSKVQGNFGTLKSGDEKSEVEFLGETKVDVLDVENGNIDVKVDGNLEVGEYKGDTEEVKDIKKNIDDQNEENDKSNDNNANNGDNYEDQYISKYSTIVKEIDGITFRFNYYFDYDSFTDRKMHKAKFYIDLGNTELNTNEKNGIGVLITDENNVIIDTLTVKPSNNVLNCTRIKLQSSKVKVFLKLKSKGTVIFNVK